MVGSGGSESVPAPGLLSFLPAGASPLPFPLAAGGASLPFPLAAGAGTLSVLMAGSLEPLTPAVAVDITVAVDWVAVVLAWVLTTLAQREGWEGVVGKRSTVERKSFLGTLGQDEGEGLGVGEEGVVVGGVC
ncbi:hypothetical protein NDU88_003376 [Pleurodeles waltl]|uniref:Uncharacterized protein n=1 Tax=Pleurodeles waltl TaxID=8319 RepID=A0AAV7MYC3_PLEWA|nr:hypothetical protein NDU88_003376 [Pleurodeles waltl]